MLNNPKRKRVRSSKTGNEKYGTSNFKKNTKKPENNFFNKGKHKNKVKHVKDSNDELPYWIDNTPDYEDEDEKKPIKIENNSYSDDTESDIEDSASDISEEDSKKNIKVKSNDVEEGRTLFIRNIPFSVTNEDLKNCFSKFGKLEYALICIDKLTEHSKGTGFVKFKDKKAADECLLQNNKITLEDNPLLICLAVSKDNLEKEKEKKVIKDSRNLYLAKEGVIMAGSNAAKGVSAADMAKRLEIEQWKSQMLKNLNMFISNRRMVIYNLPPTYDDAQLKALFMKYGNPNAVIKEARVMRDKKKIDGKTGLGISKEYGFVAFTEHQDALTALRRINNNPSIFSIKKRPIVSFSVESKAALNAKQKRLEKSRIKLGIDENKQTSLMKLNRKQRRFIKRKQKFIERRKEIREMKRNGQEPENPKKRKSTDSSVAEPTKKKSKTSVKSENEEAGDYCGVESKPGAVTKMRSRFKLRNQAKIHMDKLKEERRKKMKKKQKKKENVKQPKQKQKNKFVKDDSNVGELLKKRKRDFENVSSMKKWDE